MATRRAKSPSCTGQAASGWTEQIDLASSLDSAKLKNLSLPMVPAGAPPVGQVRPGGAASRAGEPPSRRARSGIDRHALFPRARRGVGGVRAVVRTGREVAEPV